jgi:hypothetical protein
MGGVSLRGGRWEMARPMAIIQFKMKDACIISNVIKKF